MPTGKKQRVPGDQKCGVGGGHGVEAAQRGGESLAHRL